MTEQEPDFKEWLVSVAQDIVNGDSSVVERAENILKMFVGPDNKIHELIEDAIHLADTIDPKIAEHLDGPPDEDLMGDPLLDEALDWLSQTLEACQAAVENKETPDAYGNQPKGAAR